MSPARSRTTCRFLHGPQVHAIARCDVVQTFGDAPRSNRGLPGSLLLGQPSHERLGVTLHGVELIVQVPQIRREIPIHRFLDGGRVAALMKVAASAYFGAQGSRVTRTATRGGRGRVGEIMVAGKYFATSVLPRNLDWSSPVRPACLLPTKKVQAAATET